MRDLQSLDFPTWDAATRRLVREGDGAVPALMALADHEEEALQERAVYVLGEIGPPASSAADLLLRKVESEHLGFSFRAVESLRLIAGSDAAAAALDRLIRREFLPREVSQDRIERVRGLIRLLRYAGPASFQILLDLEEHPEKEVRQCAAQELCEIPDPPMECLPRISGLLGNRERAQVALQILPRYGASARGAAPQVIELLKDDDLGHAAASALWAIAPEVIPHLFDGRDAKTCHLGTVLYHIGGRGAKVATPVLIRLVGGADVEMRDAAVKALGVLRAAEAVPALLHLFQQEKSSREKVAEALGRIGPGAISAVPVLVKALDDRELSAELPCALLESLAEIGGDTERLLPVFLRALSHRDGNVRCAAFHGLWTLKAGRAEVEKVLQDQDPWIRTLAKRVLARIDGAESDRDGLRFDWFTTDEHLRNGIAFDRGTCDVPEATVLIVPESADIVRVDSSPRMVLFMEKTLSFAGNERLQPQNVRETMGCAWKVEGRTIRIATFGEWGSIEGGTSLHLRIDVPRGVQVRMDRSLEGESSPANRTLANRKGRPASGWSKVEAVPDEESARRR